MILVSQNPQDSLKGFSWGLEHRDTLLCLMPGQVLFLYLFRVPLKTTWAEQALWGRPRGLWIDGTRIASTDKTPAPQGAHRGSRIGPVGHRGTRDGSQDLLGRWPPNLLLVGVSLGEASRFFPRFENLAECLQWVDRLINGPQ